MVALMQDSVGYVDRLPKTSRRIIKTHLPPALLPQGMLDKCKVVWVTRNPKDSVVSWFHHEKLLPVHALDEKTPFADFAKLYADGEVLYGDYFAHLKEAWALKDHPNVRQIWYEDMKTNQKGVIKDLAAFLGVDFPEDKVDLLNEHLKFENFRNNDACNMKPPKGAVPDEIRDNFNFIRKGKVCRKCAHLIAICINSPPLLPFQVGGWKEHFNEEALKNFDAWIEKNNDANIPIRFED